MDTISKKRRVGSSAVVDGCVVVFAAAVTGDGSLATLAS